MDYRRIDYPYDNDSDQAQDDWNPYRRYNFGIDIRWQPWMLYRDDAGRVVVPKHFVEEAARQGVMGDLAAARFERQQQRLSDRRWRNPEQVPLEENYEQPAAVETTPEKPLTPQRRFVNTVLKRMLGD